MAAPDSATEQLLRDLREQRLAILAERGDSPKNAPIMPVDGLVGLPLCRLIDQLGPASHQPDSQLLAGGFSIYQKVG